ncbi:RNA ligase-domain-containing protein [Powellomyces hirtus]|nr:RNA ligase-domain-containing protein [Powellomyces hirtus]
MTLPTSFETSSLKTYVANKKLRCKVHPSNDLLIWNYTEAVQAYRQWDDITMQCRGLVTDQQGTVVARSFSKFFNEAERSYQATPDFTVYTKMDGCLGILFCYRGSWIMASRGSFDSSQAIIGAEILREKYPDLCRHLDPDLAYSFEIIYPENRIVVDYGAQRRLVFLAAFRTDGSEDLAQRDLLRQCGVDVVQEHPAASMAELRARDLHNEEGYVVRFANGTRIKVKFARYLALHKVGSNMNAPWLLEQYASGMPFDKVCEGIPDEFMKWAETVYANIDTEFQRLSVEADAEFVAAIQDAGGEDCTRAAFARAIQSSQIKPALFMMFSKQDARKKLLALIDPAKMESQTAAAPIFTERRVRPSAKDSLPSLVVLLGISGSGKTTFARRWVATHVSSVVVSRDALRDAMFVLTTPQDREANKTSKGFAAREKEVVRMELTAIRHALLRGQTVLADGPYLDASDVLPLLSAVPHGCSVVVRAMDTALDECVRRLAASDRVTLARLADQYATFAASKDSLQQSIDDELRSTRSWRTTCETQLQSPMTLASPAPTCIVFDIDGTLATRHNRHRFDESKVLSDLVVPDVAAIARALHKAGSTIVMCTGRTEGCRADTEQWLCDNEISFSALYMRQLSDRRADFLIKEDMWREIHKTHVIGMMFDDRAQVVHHARRLGFTVAQVAYCEV